MLLLVSALFPKIIKAQVVINEVLANPSGPSTEPDEYIELFNKGAEEITLSGWQITDTKGATKTYTIPDTTVGAGFYVSFHRSVTTIILNNDGDGVELRNSDALTVDSMAFDGSIEDKSWSRIPNGTGNFVNGTNPTELAENMVPPTPDPTNTAEPTVTPTSTPTPTPTPTKTPTPTSKPTNTPSPKSAPTPTPKIAKTPTADPNVLSATTSASFSGMIENLPDLSKDDETSDPDAGFDDNVKGANKITLVSSGFVVLGVILIITAIFSAVKTAKSKPSENDI
jgi:hypothetical protein